MISIRRFEEDDWPVVWGFIKPVFRAGDTYAFLPDITEEEAHRVWVKTPAVTYVAVDDQDTILGTYYIKPNQPGSGAHICNSGYIVAENSRGQGIAGRMCDHSQGEAIAQGFLAMQFNLVVSTNVGAIRLWKRKRFTVIGTIPKAFNHPKQGFVDALIMYKQLSENTKEK
jgi:ribosomal protein S18 acetylase RimI-like enzyme